MADPIGRPASPGRARHRAAPQLPSASPVPRVSSPPITGTSSSSAGGPSRANRPFHDAAVAEACRLETFQTGYSTKNLMASLSDRLIQRSKTDPGPFNPKPFIRTFESAVDSLLTLRGTLTAQEAQLASSVQVSESAYTSKLHSLSSAFQSVNTSFTSLESRFSEVGRTALQIGEQLETIDRLRTRAAEAIDLIEYYYQFARGDTSRLDKLRKEGGREGRLRTAVIARRLAAIAREVDMPGADKTRETIDAFSERFERDMLKLFDKFYRKSDPKMMSHIAKVLQGFNGGHSCVQIYVNQHDFFISRDRQLAASMEGHEESEGGIWAELADPDALPPKSETSLAELFKEIRSTVEIEAQIISAVFPSPMLVMSTFLQRVFAQSVQGMVERIMERAAGIANAGTSGQATTSGGGAESSSGLAFLRMLHLTRSMALSLVSDLKQYDFRGAGIVGGPGAAGRGEGSGVGSILSPGAGAGPSDGGATGAGAGGASSLGAMLDQAVEELFVPYMDGVKYLDRESRNLTDLCGTYLLPFAKAHRAAPQVKTSTIFDRVRAQVTTASGSSASGASVASSNTTAASSVAPSKSSAFGFGKLTGLVDLARNAASGNSSSAATSADVESQGAAGMTPNASGLGVMGSGNDGGDEAGGELTLEAAERMLRWHAEAIGRCVDLSSPGDVAKNAFALLKVLTEAVIKSYVEVALDAAHASASAQDARGTQLPDLSALGTIRRTDLILQLWQHYVSTALVPLASSSVTVRREMTVFNNHGLLRVEGKCDAVMQKLTDNIVSYLSGRLSTQRKNDFTPKNDELAFARMNTDPCVACVDALRKVKEAAHNPVTGLGGGKDAEALLTEVGVSFHGLLLEHLKKYTVSAAGGIVLGQDLSSYQDAVSSFGIAQLTERFDMLRQLGNLFILPPRVLQGFMREGHLAKIEPRLLRPYLLRRADYAKDVRDLDETPYLVAHHGSGNTVTGLGLGAGSGLGGGETGETPMHGHGHGHGAGQGVPAKLDEILRTLEIS